MIRNFRDKNDLHYVVEAHSRICGIEYQYDDSFARFVAEGIAAFERNHKAGRENVWIAELDGKPAGCIGITEAEEHTAQLRWFLMEPDARGKGYGRLLLEHAVQFCLNNGYKRIILWTSSQLKGARMLYNSCGFRQVEERRELRSGQLLTEEKWGLSLPPE
ncbi:GNAT family N-acetyltransferase [Paenibacillus jiagnxiensis]|uniref:GNAT family N-acetyltransferase n=1 Tax=Paenibacillus jiagnxiensis TaxID=3228926 RepID=UPI0033B73552